MSVFEFDKSLLERLEESAIVLQCKGAAVPASEVRSEWSYHVELLIEPAGKCSIQYFLRPIILQCVPLQAGKRCGKFHEQFVRIWA